MERRRKWGIALPRQVCTTGEGRGRFPGHSLLAESYCWATRGIVSVPAWWHERCDCSSEMLHSDRIPLPRPKALFWICLEGKSWKSRGSTLAVLPRTGMQRTSSPPGFLAPSSEYYGRWYLKAKWKIRVILETQVKRLLGHYRWPKRVNWIISELSALRKAVNKQFHLLCSALNFAT